MIDNNAKLKPHLGKSRHRKVPEALQLVDLCHAIPRPDWCQIDNLGGLRTCDKHRIRIRRLRSTRLCFEREEHLVAPLPRSHLPRSWAFFRITVGCVFALICQWLSHNCPLSVVLSHKKAILIGYSIWYIGTSGLRRNH